MKKKRTPDSCKSSCPASVSIAPCVPASPTSALAPGLQGNENPSFHAKPHPGNVDRRQKLRDRLLEALSCDTVTSDSSLLSPGVSPGVSSGVAERFGGFHTTVSSREQSIISTVRENIDKSSSSESTCSEGLVESMTEVGDNSMDFQSQTPLLQRDPEYTIPPIGFKLGCSSSGDQENRNCEESSVHSSTSRLPTEDGYELESESTSPSSIAIAIEAEIFISFSGKKYSEKARTLVYNLKKNPELRDKVVGGHVTPTHFCNLSIDELAQSDLSNWRIARAQKSGEHMVMKTTDINVVVKYTHKGEVMVDLEKAGHGDEQ